MPIVTIKTSELTGIALRWAVAKSEKLDVSIPAWADSPWLIIRRGGFEMLCPQFEADWSQGGPIIERLMAKGAEMHQGGPEAANQRCRFKLESQALYSSGPTLLVAALRCFVVSELGDEVDVPEELMAEVETDPEVERERPRSA